MAGADRPDEVANSPAPAAGEGRTGPWLLLCLLLILVGAGLHLWYLLDNCPIDLSGDEAHYWEWSRHLDLSYYSKGPLVAYIIAVGRWLLGGVSQRLLGNEVLAVRGPAIVLSVITALGIFALAQAATRRPKLALAAVAVTFTIPILVAGAVLMTIDAPLMCVWVWALVCVERAIRRDRVGWWAACGLLIAVGILAKYTMVLLLPAVGLAIIADPGLRRHLRRPGPYVATAIGLLGLLPILVWNARHDWVSLRHVAGQAGVSGGPHLDFLGVLAYVAGQIVVLGVVWPLGMWAAMAACWRNRRTSVEWASRPPAGQLLFFAAATPWAVFLIFSPLTKVQPNWPALSVPPATTLLVWWLARRLASAPPATRRWTRAIIAAGVLVGGGMGLVGHRTDWLLPAFDWLARGSPPLGLTRAARPWELTPIARYDPTARLRGWSQLGRAVGEQLAAARAAGAEPFILAEDYQMASLIAFYTPGHPPVYSAQSALGGRLSQYDLWPNPIRDAEQFVGRPCLYVGSLQPELTGEGGRRAALPGLRLLTTVECRPRGYLLATWSIFECSRFAGFETDRAGAPHKY